MHSIENGSKRASRCDFPSTIEYLVDSPSVEAVCRAVTVNISTSGIAAYVFSRHPEGQKIIIKTPLPIDCRVATVRWIKKEDESFYLAGLKFIDHFPPS
jgi:hypothetical protein